MTTITTPSDVTDAPFLAVSQNSQETRSAQLSAMVEFNNSSSTDRLFLRTSIFGMEGDHKMDRPRIFSAHAGTLTGERSGSLIFDLEQFFSCHQRALNTSSSNVIEAAYMKISAPHHARCIELAHIALTEFFI